MHEKEIEILRGQLKESKKMPIYNVLQKMNLLAYYLYENINKKEKNDRENKRCKEVDELCNEIINTGTREIQKEEEAEKIIDINNMIERSYQIRARRHFEDYLVATEYEFDIDSKFYEIRRNVLKDWVIYLELLEYGELKGLSISAPPRTGKALSMDSKILTPKGWKLMKDIKEGEYVIGADGKRAEVLGVFPQGIKEMYRVNFDDNTSVKCSGDHLWTVKTRDDRKNGKSRTVKTTDMLKNVLVEKGKRKNYSIEYVKPVEFENKLKEDDLEPYLIGAIIGNGAISSNKVGFSTGDKELIKKIEKILPKTDKINYICKYDYSITKKEDIRNEKGYPVKSKTTEKLIEYELYGKKSTEKFIPKKYLYSSIENRIELLRGLMDTDGYTDGSGTAEYATVSEKLAQDVKELVRSLGGRVTEGTKIGKYKNKKGKTVECNKVYRLYIKMPINPFWLKRKANKYITRDKHIRKYKYITSIERIEDEECQCIYVDNADHLFVTDGYNITHNTTVGVKFFEWCMLRHPEKSCFFVSHTTAMANKVYKDILNDFNDERRNIKKIFEEFEIAEQSSEYMYIRLKHHGSNPYHTAYFRGIDGNMAGILEASWLLYCDDLIKNIEEAMNPDRLENARNKYGIDIRQRKSNKNVRELHIATRWSTEDVISTLEKEHGEDKDWKFIKKPALNEEGKSNFMYKGEYALDEEYFLQQRNSPMMDEISFSCIYQQDPIDREGLMFSENNVKFYNGELPEYDPDLICAACDVAWGGGDYVSFPIAKVYGYDVFITDWVYSKEKKTITKPLVIGAIEGNKISKAHFEANNGGDEYARDIREKLREDNYRCAITDSRVPTTMTKLARIQACSDEITGISDKYKIYFLEPMARKKKPMYNLAMKHLFLFSQSAKKQGKQKDDVPDSLANLITNVLDGVRIRGEAKSTVSRKELGV